MCGPAAPSPPLPTWALPLLPARHSLDPLLQVSGTGKLPFLALEQQQLDFGEVVVGGSSERLLRLANCSPVAARYRLAPELPGGAGQQQEVQCEAFSVTPQQ